MRLLERKLPSSELWYIYQVLRLACAMCFIGHGIFGVITKSVWCNYMAVFGIQQQMAYLLMPVIGIFDIFFGLSLLFYTTSVILWWLVIWATFTALLRPLSGESVAEFYERAGNFGAPYLLLILSGNFKNGSRLLLQKIKVPLYLDSDSMQKIYFGSRMIGCMLLAAHGFLALSGKRGLVEQAGLMGFSSPAFAIVIIGCTEILAAASILFQPSRRLILILILWKLFTESFYLHWAVFEWIERGGSYGVLVVTYILTPFGSDKKVTYQP